MNARGRPLGKPQVFFENIVVAPTINIFMRSLAIRNAFYLFHKSEFLGKMHMIGISDRNEEVALF